MTATPETQEDIAYLLARGRKTGRPLGSVNGREVEVTHTRTHRAHKKHNFKKVCPVVGCGEEFKGKLGIGIHMHKKHGMPRWFRDHAEGEKVELGGTGRMEGFPARG